MGLKLILAPATPPISIDDAKEHSYIDPDIGTDDDTIITQMINSATDLLQNYTGLQLVDATYMQTLDNWQTEIELLKNPVKSISSIKYYDEDNILQTLDSSNYTLDDFVIPNRIIIDKDFSLPTLKDKVNSIEITFIAGYTTIPDSLISWIKLQFADLYENRESFVVGVSANALPNRYAKRLLDSYKVY